MFNEIGYSSTQLGALNAGDCAALKENCNRRFPPSDDPEVLAGIKPDLNWDCMKSTGYVSQCMNNKSYDEPGATMYPVDVLTNPDNPHSLIPDLSAIGLSGGAWGWAVIALGGILLLSALKGR